MTDAQLVTLARRNQMRLVTFAVGAAALAPEGTVELLRV